MPRRRVCGRRLCFFFRKVLVGLAEGDPTFLRVWEGCDRGVCGESLRWRMYFRAGLNNAPSWKTIAKHSRDGTENGQTSLRQRKELILSCFACSCTITQSDESPRQSPTLCARYFERHARMPHFLGVFGADLQGRGRMLGFVRLTPDKINTRESRAGQGGCRFNVRTHTRTTRQLNKRQ